MKKIADSIYYTLIILSWAGFANIINEIIGRGSIINEVVLLFVFINVGILNSWSIKYLTIKMKNIK